VSLKLRARHAHEPAITIVIARGGEVAALTLALPRAAHGNAGDGESDERGARSEPEE
jgi:hypothetical protein